MPFQPAEDACVAELKWTGPGDIRWQNNLHFTKAEFDEDDQDVLAAIIGVTFGLAAIKQDVSTDCGLGSVVVTDLRTQGAPQVTAIVGTAGINAADMAAQGAAMVATMRTSVRGRSYRGRFYMAGLGDDILIDGEWILAAAGRLAEFLEDVQEAALGAGFTMVVLSRWLNQVERQVALGQEIIQILIRSLHPGSQRRRNRRP